MMCIRSKLLLTTCWLVLASVARATEAPPPLTDREVEQAAQDGRMSGQSLMRSANLPEVDREAKTITINGEAVPFRELMPGSERLGGLPTDAELSAMAGNQRLIDEAARAKIEQLENAVTVEGQVYRDLRNGKRATDADIRGVVADTQKHAQPLWQDTLKALNVAKSGAHIGQCTTETRWIGAPNETGYTMSQKSCERIHKLDRCERTREVSDASRDDVGIVERSHTLAEPGVFDVDVNAELGSDEVLIGASARVSFTGPATSVAITQQPTRANGWKVIYHVDPSSAPPVTTCVDMVGNVCTAGSPGCICTTQSAAIQVSVVADLDIVKESFSSVPDDCLLETDQFCSARWTCDDMDTRTVAGVEIDQTIGAQLGMLYPNVAGNVPQDSRDPVCYRATAIYQCDFMLGQLCWTDAQGRQQCVNNTEENTMLDTCAGLRQEPKCTHARTMCAEGARGHGGFCYVEDILFECREQSPASAIEPVTEIHCDGELRCTGTECAPIETEHGGGFAKAQAGLTVAQHFLADRKQTPGMHDMTVFAGKPMECKKALGSLASCCTETTTAAPKDWMNMYSERMRLGSVNDAIRTLSRPGTQATGAWADMAPGATVDKEVLHKNFTAPIETITGGGDISTAGLPQTANLQELNGEFILKARADYQPNLTWTCSQEEFDLANQKEIGSCTEIGSYCKTSVFGACLDKRTVSCCFASPLSRQIRETIAGGQAGIMNGALGTPKNPRCEGVTMEHAATSNVSALNLDEWVGRMQKAGALPTQTAEQMDEEYSLEKLTGSTSVANQLHVGPDQAKGGVPPRMNTVARTAERFENVDIEGATQQIEAAFISDDPGRVDEVNGAGEVYLAPAYTATIAGRPAMLYFTRVGTVGRVSVKYRLVPGTARADVHYIDRSGTIVWDDGQEGLQTMSVPTVRSAGQVAVLDFRVELYDVAGGAVLGETRTGKVVINPIR